MTMNHMTVHLISFNQFYCLEEDPTALPLSIMEFIATVVNGWEQVSVNS